MSTCAFDSIACIPSLSKGVPLNVFASQMGTHHAHQSFPWPAFEVGPTAQERTHAPLIMNYDQYHNRWKASQSPLHVTTMGFQGYH